MNLEPREIKAAVMFVDVEGFSRIAVKKSPDVLFSELRESLSRVARSVRAHGGVVNKTIGEGLFCYFTDLDSNGADAQNALTKFTINALRSAIEVQREFASELIRREVPDETDSKHVKWNPLPVRIGINVGSVFYGNVAADGMDDEFTVVGETVNVGKRLEGAGDVFKVLVSPAAKALLDDCQLPLDFGAGAVWGRRFLQVKNQTGLFEAWECNPFGNDAELLKQAMRQIRTGNKRSSPRIPWLCEVSLNAATADGNIARVVDFSENGLCLEFAAPMPRKDQLAVTLTTGRADWNAVLVNKGLANVTCDIRWVEAVGQMHWHGVAYVGLPQEQTRALSELLIQFNNRASEEI
ncbi:hypothetical protein EBU99_05650 [bacterium]|nr:hypothetical protein [bacterium]